MNVRQVETVEGIPDFIAGRDSPQPAKLATRADLSRDYISSSFLGMLPYLQALPHAYDDLTCEFGIDVYRKMASDAEVAANLNMLVMSSCSQELRLTTTLDNKHPDHQKAQWVADFFQWMFDNLDGSLWATRKSMVKQGLMFGSSVGELNFEIAQGGKYAGYYVLRRVRPTAMSETAFVVDNYRNVVGIIPSKLPNVVFPAGSMIPLTTRYDGMMTANEQEIPSILPRAKFLVMTWDSEAGDPRGRSIMRASYTPWWAKQQLVNEMLSWFAKFSQPSIWGETAPNAVAQCYTDPDTGVEIVKEPTQLLLEAMLGFRNASVMAVPSGSKIHTLDMSGGGDIFLKAIGWANKEITRSLLMQHLATSDSEHMARASSETHQDILSLMILNLRMWQGEAIKRDILKPLTVANFGESNVHLCPKVDLGDGDGFPLNLTEVAMLQSAGWFTPDQMAVVDKLLGLPVRKVQSMTADEINPFPVIDQSVRRQLLQQKLLNRNEQA